MVCGHSSPDDGSVERRLVATVTVRGNESQFTFRGDLTATSIWPGEILASVQAPLFQNPNVEVVQAERAWYFFYREQFQG